LAPSAPFAAVGGAVLVPLVTVPWVLLCACLWFHPKRGNLQPNSRFVGLLPATMQTFIRWYAAVVLGLFVSVSVVAWPLLALAWLFQ
jgi:hypothetical protein